MLVITEKQKNETARQYAVRTILYNIVNLNLKPSEKIIESDLCEQLGISRTPIREALLELNKRQMIDIHPKRGTYVSMVDIYAIDDFVELRTLLEGELSKIACEMFTKRDFEYLRENIAIWKYHASTRNSAKMQEYDKEFHNYIYRRCNRLLWLNIITTSSYQFDRTVIMLQNAMATDFLADDHNAIVNAIESKDKELARKVTVEHAGRLNEMRMKLRHFYPEYFK